MATPDFIGKFTANNPGHHDFAGDQSVYRRQGDRAWSSMSRSAPTRTWTASSSRPKPWALRKSTKILLTHIHSDHTGGALALRKRCGAKLGIHRSRKGYLGGEDFQYDDNDRIDFGGGELHVLHTPGHESGHCCFYEGGDKVLVQRR